MGTRKSDLSALIISLSVHGIFLFALALFTFTTVQETQVAVETIFSEERQQEEFSQNLDMNTEVSENLSLVSGATVAAVTGGSNAPAVNQEKLEESESLKEPEIRVNTSTVSLPGLNMLGNDLGEGEVTGETGAIVDGYGTAMSRLTKEILRMMRQDRVHVVWLFDESESMKDDQEEIRDQFEKVYEELGIAQKQDAAKGKNKKGKETLLTTILGFGEKVHQLTPKPTNDIPTIKSAITKIPIDESGKENLCKVISQVCDEFGPLAQRGDRKLVLVVVSDESGDDGQFVEEAVTRLKRYRAPVYVMGREAIFGFPFARIRWQDPKYKLWHWVDIKRGPETAFVESLQHDGLHRRWDSFSSGFGPYEQVRICKESGGIFFLLPGEEEDLTGQGKFMERKFDFLAMQEYEPLLLPRREYEMERGKSKFRQTIWEVIATMNPYQDNQLNIREHWYKFEPEGFATDANKEGSKAMRAFGLYNEALRRLESVRKLRDAEESMRWRAAYDITVAQCMTYRVRLFQLMLAMDAHMANPPKPKDPKSNRWHARRTKNLLKPTEAQVKKTKVDWEALEGERKRAESALQQVKKDHPGTPWAQRASWEIGNGMGFTFVESFWNPNYEKVGKDIKIPKF